jgi:hypothetical protein
MVWLESGLHGDELATKRIFERVGPVDGADDMRRDAN